MPSVIQFYRVSDPYGCFSNFSSHPIQLDGKVWPTSEHYFQAQKFRDEDLQEQVRQTASPMIAARFGRDRSKPLRPDWEAVKDDVMRRAVRAKFTQHGDLRLELLATGMRCSWSTRSATATGVMAATAAARTCSGAC